MQATYGAGLLLGKAVPGNLGHVTFRVAIDTYSHVVPSMQREAAEKAERLVLRTGQ